MKLYLPNSANLQNIEGFFKRYSPKGPKTLQFKMHDRYVHVHPAALAMAACLGEAAHLAGVTLRGRVRRVRSLPYLIRMGLFPFLRLDPGQEIAGHEEAGRFIPLTQIRNNEELKAAIVNVIPLLHAESEIANPIRYLFSELVRNALEHARSPVGAFVCAQYYRNSERLSIGVADAGRGIRASITEHHPVTSAMEAIALALQPGVTGVTRRIGGNESNAGAGLFFTKGIARLSRNYFIIYSDDCLFKLLRGPESGDPVLYTDPADDPHFFTIGLPEWRGTVVGIDISVAPGSSFSELLSAIDKAYDLDVKKRKKAYYKMIQFLK